jgi:FixJ family two-component response regulator
MTETYQSTCFWLTSPVPNKDNTNELSKRMASLFRIETHQVASDTDYEVLRRQLPGHVVVIDTTGSDPLTSAECLSARISKVLTFGNKPTIVCLGNRAPTALIVDWMRQSIFAYAETDSHDGRVAELLRAAFVQADSVLSKFERFQVLNSRKVSLTPPEKDVLEMILEGVPNKTIATKLSVSQRTIEARRHKLYLKMGSKSLPGVVQSICEWKELAAQFGGPTPCQPSRPSNGESGGESARPPRGTGLNTELVHSSESIATPKLQATARQHQQLDANCS